MYIPQDIHALLDERIAFCEAQLQYKFQRSKISAERIENFRTALQQYRELKKLLDILTKCDNENDKHKQRVLFSKVATEMIGELITCCKKQMEGVEDLLLIYYTLNLIEGLEKIKHNINDL